MGEGQVREVIRGEPTDGFQIVASDRLSFGAGGENGEHNGLSGLGVEAQERPDLDRQPDLLARLAGGGVLHPLAPLDEAGWEAPAAGGTGARSPPSKEDPAAALDQHGDSQLRVKVRHRTTRLADRACSTVNLPLSRPPPTSLAVKHPVSLPLGPITRAV